jgi:hypothetical protein
MDLETITLIKMAIVAALALLSYRKTQAIASNALQREQAMQDLTLREIRPTVPEEKKEETDLSTSAVSQKQFVSQDNHNHYLELLRNSSYGQADDFGEEEDNRSERSIIAEVLDVE